MLINNSVVIIGAPGSGKSSIAKSLSKVLGLHFYDMDEEIETKYGVATEWLIEIEGIESLTSKALPLIKEILQRKHIILATNSEAMVSAAIRDELSATSIVVYLYRHNRQDPHALPANPPLKPLEHHCDDHFHSIYLKSADIAVNIDKKNINMLTQEIMNTILRNKYESKLS